MAYNEDGLVIATRDANDNVVELDYDIMTGHLPVTERFFVEIGALELTAGYDTGYGAITEATDLNGNTSRFYYDGLGRLTDIVDPLGILNQPTTHYDYQYGTSDNPILLSGTSTGGRVTTQTTWYLTRK
jgi:YD repeat-containing protein